MFGRKATRFSLLIGFILAGAWLLARPSGPAPETALRQQSLRQALAPAVRGAPGVAQPVTLEPITPVVIRAADIPANVYDTNNQYARWLRGEIDLDEWEYRRSRAEVAALQAEAQRLAPSAAVQRATSDPGLAAPTPGVSFDSLDVTECCGGGASVPPDPHLAAGPNHLIAAVNVAFEVYDKSGTSLLGPTTFVSFFAPLAPCIAGPNGAFDPTVVYDEEADRWLIGVDGNGTHFCVAASTGSNPTGTWNLYMVPAQPIGGEFHDYPHMGVGDDYIVVGANQFGGAIPDSFEGRVWALDKAVMYAGGALSPVTASLGLDGGTPQPLHLHGTAQGSWPGLGSEHYVATDYYDGCRTDIWRWNVPAAPTVVATLNLCTATSVSGGMPVNFPQMGGSAMQANDWRMRGFEYRNGSGWIADSISCNPGSGTVDCVRWTEVDLTGPTPALVQAGVYASNGSYRTFPDLAVNACGDMAIGYTRSSTSEYPGIWVTGRLNTDPAGTLGAEVLQKAGEVAYTAFDPVPRRWGDYTSMAIDPDGLTFWYLGQYSKNLVGTTRWGTHVGAYSYASCVPAPAAAVDPVALTHNQAPGISATIPLTISNAGTLTLTWTLSEAPASLGPGGPCDAPADVPWLSLSPLAGATPTLGDSVVDVAIDTTGLTPGGFEGYVCLSSNDPVTPLVTIPLSLTVDAYTYGVTLAPDGAASAAPGAVVTYTLTLINTGNGPDTFTIGLSGNAWTTGATPTTAPLAPGAGTTVTVTVTIAASAADGAQDVVTVQATSAGDGSAQATATLTTTAVWPRLYLPSMLRP